MTLRTAAEVERLVPVAQAAQSVVAHLGALPHDGPYANAREVIDHYLRLHDELPPGDVPADAHRLAVALRRLRPDLRPLVVDEQRELCRTVAWPTADIAALEADAAARLRRREGSP